MTDWQFHYNRRFICLQFCAIRMLKDLGLFAAFQPDRCFIVLVDYFFPPPGAHINRKRNFNGKPPQFFLTGSLHTGQTRTNNFVIAIFLITGVFIYTSRWVRFETDMMRMNYMSHDLRDAEKRLNDVNAYALQSIYLVSSGDNLNDALVNNEKAISTVEMLKQQGIVTKYSGVSSLIISDSLQKVRIERWKNY
jgi:hypothetical protein